MELQLRKLRKERGLTQKDVSDAIGMSFRAVQSWERGENYPNAENIWKLSQLFGVDPNTLLDWPADDGTGRLNLNEMRLIESYRKCTDEWRSVLVMSAKAFEAQSVSQQQM